MTGPMLALGAYLWLAIVSIVFIYDKVNQAAWMAPRWAVVALSVIAGLFWWVTLLVLLVAWGREAVRRRGW